MRYLIIVTALLFLSCEDPSNEIDSDTESLVPDPDIEGDCFGNTVSGYDPTTGLCWVGGAADTACYNDNVNNQYKSLSAARCSTGDDIDIPSISQALTLVRNCDLRDCPLADPSITPEAKYLSDPRCFGCSSDKPIDYIDTDIGVEDGCKSLYSRTLVSDLKNKVWMLYVTETSIDIIYVDTDIAKVDGEPVNFVIECVYTGKMIISN